MSCKGAELPSPALTWLCRELGSSSVPPSTAKPSPVNPPASPSRDNSFKQPLFPKTTPKHKGGSGEDATSRGVGGCWLRGPGRPARRRKKPRGAARELRSDHAAVPDILFIVLYHRNVAGKKKKNTNQLQEGDGSSFPPARHVLSLSLPRKGFVPSSAAGPSTLQPRLMDWPFLRRYFQLFFSKYYS